LTLVFEFIIEKTYRFVITNLFKWEKKYKLFYEFLNGKGVTFKK